MRMVLLATSLVLTACQAPNPYQASSQPLPPAPAGAAQTFDRSAYPAEPIDFARFRSWRWSTVPAGTAGLSGAQVQEIVASALEQQGLRQAQPNAPADLLAQLNLAEETREQWREDRVGVGYANDPYWGNRYGTYGSMPIGHLERYQVLVLRLTLSDAQGRPLWTAHNEARSAANSADLSEALREAARQLLAHYPPG